jgi:hypothetical protein
MADGIDVGNEVIMVRKRSRELDLEILPGLANTDAVVLREAIQ